MTRLIWGTPLDEMSQSDLIAVVRRRETAGDLFWSGLSAVLAFWLGDRMGLGGAGVVAVIAAGALLVKLSRASTRLDAAARLLEELTRPPALSLGSDLGRQGTASSVSG